MIANYFNLIIGEEPKNTFSFDELYKVQSIVLEYKDLSDPPEGYPLFFYSHQHYRKVFEQFDTIAYVYRNPLDTLISYYYFSTRREKPFGSHQFNKKMAERLLDIDEFVLHFIMSWIFFHIRTVGRANVVLSYERMREDPTAQFAPLIESMIGKVDIETLNRSI